MIAIIAFSAFLLAYGNSADENLPDISDLRRWKTDLLDKGKEFSPRDFVNEAGKKVVDLAVYLSENRLTPQDWSAMDHLVDLYVVFVKAGGRDEAFDSSMKILAKTVRSLAKYDEGIECGAADMMWDHPDFFQFSPYPDSSDLLGVPTLTKNQLDGPMSLIEYVEMHCGLLKEDFTSVLRKGIRTYREAAKKSQGYFDGIWVYKNVVVENRQDDVGGMDRGDYVVHLAGSPDLKNGRKFMAGSLLMFTTNDFDDFFLATVSDSNEKLLQNSSLMVNFVKDDDLRLSKGKAYVMAECDAFFEPLLMTSRKLQSFREYNFPMAKYILYCDMTPRLPSYLLEFGNKVIDVLGYKVNVDDPDSWPSSSDLDLDEQQLDALKSGLTKEFAVIQGPPGTGKTFIGVKILRVLLENFKNVFSRRDKTPTGSVSFKLPIVIVCQTNHALDQFLEAVVDKITKNVIRVGSQTKSEIMTKYSLYDRRKSIRNGRLKFPDVRGLYKKMNYYKSIVDGMDQDGLISCRTLETNSNNYKLAAFLSDNVTFAHWLLEKCDKEKAGGQSQSKRKGKNVSKESDEVDGCDDEAQLYAKKLIDDLIAKNDREAEKDGDGDSGSVVGGGSVKFALSGNDIRQVIKKLKKLSTEGKSPSGREKSYGKQAVEYERILKLLGKEDGEAYETVDDKYKYVWDLKSDDRWNLYRYWKHQIRKTALHSHLEYKALYREALREQEVLKQEEILAALKTAEVVGMTTSWAARMSDVLDDLESSVVMVEEAAEILEPHLLASLWKDCQHVILIGDHQQLRPCASSYELAKDYGFDISLFERMVRNGMECSVLTTQHRMRPEISRLLVPAIYPKLVDHESVKNRANILGVGGNVFFMSHSYKESKIGGNEVSRSYENGKEAALIIGLCKHFLLHGYSPKKITILGTYEKQVSLLTQKRDKMTIEGASDVRVSTVDAYQGEENDIILLSLVRSNPENRIGFLSVSNRVCVALSRARNGFYMFGNINTMKNDKLWLKINGVLRTNLSTITKFKIKCQVHEEVDALVEKTSDFEAFYTKHGLCKAKLDCGHSCERICHLWDPDHVDYKCKRKCQRVLCENGHPCTKLCLEDCGLCFHNVKKELDCGHAVTTQCCKSNEETTMCTSLCRFKFPCGHRCHVICHFNSPNIDHETCAYCPKSDVETERDPSEYLTVMNVVVQRGVMDSDDVLETVREPLAATVALAPFRALRSLLFGRPGRSSN